MYKKLILMLAFGMLVVSLAGCGKNKGSAEVNEESAVDNSAADSADTLVDSVKFPELNMEEEVAEEVVETVYEPAMLACSLPKDFKPDSGEEGKWVHKSYPTELSSITYDISGGSDNYSQMTMEEYKSLMEDDFARAYGDTVTLNISVYDKIVIDRRNGFKILMSYELKEIEFEQLTYLLFNGDEVHNLTFTHEKDNDRMNDFETSAETIHFVKTE